MSIAPTFRGIIWYLLNGNVTLLEWFSSSRNYIVFEKQKRVHHDFFQIQHSKRTTLPCKKDQQTSLP